MFEIVLEIKHRHGGDRVGPRAAGTAAVLVFDPLAVGKIGKVKRGGKNYDGQN